MNDYGYWEVGSQPSSDKLVGSPYLGGGDR
jgi:hypothetical protein